MEIKEYQEKAGQTAVYDSWYKSFVEKFGHTKEVVPVEMFDEIERVFKMLHTCYAVLGLVGEAGELANKIKKVIRDNNGVMSDEKLKEIGKELGDTEWYQSALAKELGLSMDDIAQENIAKLFSRKERGVLQGDGDNR